MRTPFEPMGFLFRVLLLAACLVVPLSAAPLFETVEVFPSSPGDKPNYRIPSLVRAANGDLLAIVEKRNSGIADIGNTDIVMRRSADKGRTWSAIQTIFDDGISTCTDLTPLVLHSGPRAGRILLFFLKNKKKFACIHSDDHGATWVFDGMNPNPGYTAHKWPFIIHGSVTQPAWDALDGAGTTNAAADQPAVPSGSSQTTEWEHNWTQRYGIGPGAGAVQLRHQTNPALNGRILVSARHRERVSGQIQTWSHVFFSDDHGATWQLGATRIAQNGSESQLAELTNGVVCINLRNEASADAAADASGRLVATSTDGGVSWSAATKDTRLVSTRCHAAIELYVNPANASDPANGTLLFSNPNYAHREEDHPYGRYRMSIRTSADNTATWSDARVIYAHPSSYSDLAVLADGTIGIIYERARPSVNKYWSTLQFARFNMEWIKTPSAPADPTPVLLHNYFSEGMVLQRDKDAPVWGFAAPGDTIQVSFAGQVKNGVAGADGMWHVILDPIAANAAPRDMIVTGPRNILRVGNVLVGDVWLASGQSNMNWTLNTLVANRTDRPDAVAEHGAEIASASDHRIRMFNVASATRADPDDNITGAWTWSSPSTLTTGDFSATAYYFAKKIVAETGIPIGIASSSVGGTMIEAWMHPAAYKTDPALAFVEQLAPARTQEKDAPSSLYNAMIAPLVPAALKGFLWYQGEHNDKDPDYWAKYALLFPAHIKSWRDQFGDGALPFYFVQLPNYNTSKKWTLLREAQLSGLTLPRTGVAIAIDIGDDDNIHPVNKRAAGTRLALNALHFDYGKTALEYSGPVLENGLVEPGGTLALAFGHAAGMTLDTAKNRAGIPAFEISADGTSFVAADVALGGSMLHLSAPGLAAPRHARYAWHNTPSTPLYNASALPAIPFQVSFAGAPENLAPPPAEISLAATTGATATLNASGGGSPAPAYRWQVSTDGGATWRDISTLANPAQNHSGYNTATLTIKAATFAMSGWRYRYIATNPAGESASAASTLTITDPRLPEPAGIAIDPANNLYVTDATLGVVCKITSGVIRTFSGATTFDKPSGIAINAASGLIEFAETGANTIRTYSASAKPGTRAGASAAGLNKPSGIAIDRNGNTYVADAGNHVIRMITPAGAVSTLAGSPGSDGAINAAGAAARFKNPRGVAVSAAATGSTGHVYVADTGNSVIRVIDLATRQVGTLSGVAGTPGHSDAGAGLFSAPEGIVAGGGNIVYVADTGNHVIRELPGIGAPPGVTLKTIAGVANDPGLIDGSGTGARFRNPRDIAIAANGNLYVADTGNMAIREILNDATDTVRTLALTSGTGTGGDPEPAPPNPPSGGSSGGGGGGAPSALYFLAIIVLMAMRGGRFV